MTEENKAVSGPETDLNVSESKKRLMEEARAEASQEQKIEEPKQVEESVKAEPVEVEEKEVETDSSDDEDDVPVFEDDPKGVKKRLDKLTAQKRMEQAKTRALEEKLAAIERERVQQQLMQAANVDVQTGQPLVKPRMEDYSAWQDYARDMETYQEKKAASQQFISQQQQQQKAQEELQAAFKRKQEAARKKYEDFEEVGLETFYKNDFPISDGMAQAIHGSPHSADILYYLGKNPHISADLAKLSNYVGAKEIGKIEAQFIEPRKIKSTAPPPVPAERVESSKNENGIESMSIKDLQNRFRRTPL